MVSAVCMLMCQRIPIRITCVVRSTAIPAGIHELRVHIVSIQRYRRMVVKTLCHQLSGQTVLESSGLLDFGSLVLEPDFDLGFTQCEFFGQGPSALFGQVVALLKFLLQSLELGRAEGSARALLIGFLFPPFHLACPRSCGNNNKKQRVWLAQRKSIYH